MRNKNDGTTDQKADGVQVLLAVPKTPRICRISALRGGFVFPPAGKNALKYSQLPPIVKAFDAYVFVTPEYNHATSGALKNAIDFLYKEWNNKAAGFVSYGSMGGARAVENLRLIMGELQVADVRAQVMLSLFTDFENFSVFKPAAMHDNEVNVMLDQLIAWGNALKTVRKK